MKIQETGITLCIIYDNAEVEYVRELNKHLLPLMEKYELGVFDKEKLMPGDEQEAVSDTFLEQASIVLYLISADFLNNKTCRKQIDAIMSRSDKIMIPVIARNCYYDVYDFARCNILPRNRVALESQQQLSMAMTEIAKAIEQVVLFFHDEKQQLSIQPETKKTPASKQLPNQLNKDKIIEFILRDKIEEALQELNGNISSDDEIVKQLRRLNKLNKADVSFADKNTQILAMNRLRWSVFKLLKNDEVNQ